MMHFENIMGEIGQVCRRHNVRKLYIFGSALTEQFNKQTSDVDILVEMLPLQPIKRGEHLIQLWNELEHLFKRKVDLLTPESLHNPYLIQEIERTKSLVYDHQSAEVSV